MTTEEQEQAVTPEYLATLQHTRERMGLSHMQIEHRLALAVGERDRLKALVAELVGTCQINDEALSEATFVDGADRRTLNYAIKRCRDAIAKAKKEIGR
jgi:hypothetical protein